MCQLKYGHLHIIKYFQTQDIHCTQSGPNEAAGNGYLEVVQYLHENGIKCTKFGADKAAQNGHLHIIQYLYSQGIKCTSRGANYAAEMGHNGHLHQPQISVEQYSIESICKTDDAEDCNYYIISANEINPLAEYMPPLADYIAF